MKINPSTSTARITDALVSELLKRRVYLRPHFHFNGAIGRTVRISNEVLAEQYARIHESALSWGGRVEIGAFSYVTPGSNLGSCKIGRFCSIATNVRVMPPDHPTDRVTTSTWTYGHNVQRVVFEDFGAEILQNRNVARAKPVSIGHDVWIGENVLIRGGVTIGTGSIIGANAVVTRDVPSYAVLVGNPGRIVKSRIACPHVASELLASEWWNIAPQQLARLQTDDVSVFLSDLPDSREAAIYDQTELRKLFLAHGHTADQTTDEIG